MTARDTANTGRRSLTAGAILVTAASAIFVLSGYVVSVWLGRLLGPADYGRFGIVIGVVTILNVIQNTSVPHAVARTVAHAPELAESTLRRGAELQLMVSVALAGGVVLAAPLISNVLGDAQLTDLIRLAALTLVPYGGLALLIAFHNGTRQYVRQAVASATYAVAKAIGAVGLAHLFHLAGAIAGYILAAVIGCVVSWRSIGATRAKVPYGQLIAFAAPIAVYAIASVALMSIDIFFVKAGIADARSAGYYAASQSISRIPFYLMSGLASVLLPGVAASLHQGRDAATRTASKAIRWSLVVVVPVVALMAPTSDALIQLLYSSEYRGGGSALAILMPAIGALAISSILGGLLAGLGRPWPPAVLASTGVIVTVAACAVLVPMFGVEGAALGTFTGSAVTLLGMSVFVRKEIPGVASFATMARVTFVGGAGGMAAALLDPSGLGLIATYGALGAAVLGALVMTGDVPVAALKRVRIV